MKKEGKKAKLKETPKVLPVVFVALGFSGMWGLEQVQPGFSKKGLSHFRGKFTLSEYVFHGEYLSETLIFYYLLSMREALRSH